MPYRKVSVESYPLTPEVAVHHRNLEPLPGERELKESRLDYLSQQLQRNNFSGPDWAVGTDLSTGKEYRLDGQHSSELLVHLPEGTTFPEGLLVTVTRYEFDSMTDAADVFNLFNHPKAVRNNEDMMGIYKAKVPDLVPYPRKFLVAVGDAIYEHERGRKAKGSKEARLFGPRDRGLYFTLPTRPELLKFVHWVAQFRELKNRVFLTRPVIVSGMLGFWLASPLVAEEFWQLVFTESHPDPEDQTRSLAEWFREQLALAARPKLDMKRFQKKMQTAWKLYQLSKSQSNAA